jgi:hypothetical protein
MRHTLVVRVLHTALYPLLYNTKTATNFRHICTSSRSVWTLFSFVSIFKPNVQHVSVIEFEVNFDIEHIKFSLPLWSNGITSISTYFPHWLNISNLSEMQHWSIDIKEIFNVEVSKQVEKEIFNNVEVSKQVENASLYMNLWREYWRLLYLAPIDWTTINWKANLTPMMKAYDSLKPTRGKISFQKD